MRRFLSTLRACFRRDPPPFLDRREAEDFAMLCGLAVGIVGATGLATVGYVLWRMG